MRIGLIIITLVWLSPPGAFGKGGGSFRGPIMVKGGIRKTTGKFVMPYYQTAPNSSKLDNWSTKGNVNPYTGKVGQKDPLK